MQSHGASEAVSSEGTGADSIWRSGSGSRTQYSNLSARQQRQMGAVRDLAVSWQQSFTVRAKAARDFLSKVTNLRVR